MNCLPSVLVVSCTDKRPSDIVALLLGTLPECTELEPGIIAYPWHLDTKYYKVDINLCTLETKSLGSQKYAKSVQAVVLYFDSDDPNGLTEVNSWLPYIKEYELEIQILLCTQCKEGCEKGIAKLTAQEWCITKGYELVEINPTVDKEWDCEQDFIETTGIKRVQQALEAHIWPNLILKERKEPTTMSALLHGGLCKSAASNHIDVKEEFYFEENNPRDDEQLVDEESSTDSGFTELFRQFASMKEKASTMPRELRKEFAEQIVCAYWKAIGGDKHELDIQ